MAKKERACSEKCFIIMPITTPEDAVERYNGDAEHFSHVLDHLFLPALTNAGFDPVSPKSSGSEVIQAEIISHLVSSDLVVSTESKRLLRVWCARRAKQACSSCGGRPDREGPLRHEHCKLSQVQQRS